MPYSNDMDSLPCDALLALLAATLAAAVAQKFAAPGKESRREAAPGN